MNIVESRPKSRTESRPKSRRESALMMRYVAANGIIGAGFGFLFCFLALWQIQPLCDLILRSDQPGFAFLVVAVLFAVIFAGLATAAAIWLARSGSRRQP